MRQRWAVLGALLVLLAMLPGLSCTSVDRQQALIQTIHTIELDGDLFLEMARSRRLVRKHLDLRDPVVSELMRRRTDVFPSMKGQPSPAFPMACVLRSDPERGLSWLLDHYPGFSLGGRVNMMTCLFALDVQETYSLLLALLPDTTCVHRSSQIPPGPIVSYMRICDYAYNSLHRLVALKNKSMRGSLPVPVHENDTPEKRDALLGKFRQWWAESSPKILAEKPSIAPPGSELHEKLMAFFESSQNGKMPAGAPVWPVAGAGLGQPQELFAELEDEARWTRPGYSGYRPGYRSNAARKLAQLGAPAVPYLAEGMKSGDAHVREWSRRTLSQIGPPAIPALKALAEEGPTDVRAEALRGLSCADGVPIDRWKEEISPVYLAALEDETPEIRKWGASGLGSRACADDETFPALVHALADPSPVVRASAALAFTHRKDSSAGPYLIAALGDEDGDVRAATARVLGCRRDRGAIQALMGLRTDPSADVRWQAVGSLRRLCDLRSVRALALFLDDLERGDRGRPGDEAAGAIRKIMGCVEGSRYFNVKKWWESVGKQRYGALEIPLEPRTFWSHTRACAYKAKSALPDGWEVLWHGQRLSPSGWSRTDAAKPGVCVHARRPDSGSDDGLERGHRPAIDFFFMPIEYEGTRSHSEHGGVNATQLTATGRESPPAQTSSQALYYGSSDKLKLFYVCTEAQHCANALNEVAGAFGVKRQ